MNYPDDIFQYNWHPDSPFYDGVDVDAEWEDEPDYDEEYDYDY